jgi:xanthine dehydrogenase small subunit
VSGATDIGLWVTKQNRNLPKMIWTGRVKEFNKIDEQEGFIIIRPAVTHQEAMEKLGVKWPTINALWKRFGSVQVRNSGTVCGNLANGSPIGDLPPALIALESLIELTNRDKKRRLPLDEFFIEYGRQDRHVGEYVSGIFVPNISRYNFRCYKLSKRFDQDISAVMMGANISVEKTKISKAVICFGGMAGIPKRAMEVEKALLDQPFEPQSFITASRNINMDFDPLTDVRGSADYRRKAAQNLVIKYGYELTGSFVPNLADRNQVENLVS